MFSNTLRKNIDSFNKLRFDITSKLEGKETTLKIMSDMNQNLKRKYIKKNIEYKKACKGEAIEEPRNFFM